MKNYNILVIRSATRILNPTLASLKREFPQSRITVLAPSQAGDALAQDPLIDEAFAFDSDGRMTLFNFGLKNIRKLRERKFDLAVSLYNIDHGLGYSNVDFLACAANAPLLRGYNPQGKYVVLTPAGIAKKYLLEKTSMVWIGVNYLATGVLFALIAAGLCAEWCVRKLFSRREARNETAAAPIHCLPAAKNRSNV